MEWRSRLLLAVGVLLALAAGAATYLALTRAQVATLNAVVVVASVDIPERTLITAGNVEQLLAVRQVPTDQVPDGALREPSEAVGKAARSRIAADEVLVSSRLSTEADGSSGTVSALLPVGSVAMAIPVNDVMSVAGAVRPNDRVDIIATTTPRQGNGSGVPVTQLLMQDVKVLSVGLWGQDAGAENQRYNTVTLVLDRQQALLLQHLLQTEARLTMVLRRFDDERQVETRPVTSDSAFEGSAPAAPASGPMAPPNTAPDPATGG